MFYALRETAYTTTLVEIASPKEEQALRAAGYALRRVTKQEAHRYVRNDGHHETGLYVDDGKVRYAKADPYGY
jgi:hypothetical protein